MNALLLSLLVAYTAPGAKVDRYSCTDRTHQLCSDEINAALAEVERLGKAFDAMQPGTGAPVVVSFSPASGAPGTSVTIVGANFAGASAAYFNGAPASSITVAPGQSTQAVAIVSGTATTGHICVTTAAGSGCSTTDFTVLPIGSAPTASLSANPSTIASGQTSTLNITTAGATTCSINNGVGTVPCNGTRIVAPTTTTTYTLTATNSAGPTTATATVTVNATCVVTSVSASDAGAVAGGSAIQLAATVEDDPAACSPVTWSNATCGSVTSSGLFTPPSAVPVGDSCSVTVTSTVDATKATVQKVWVMQPPGAGALAVAAVTASANDGNLPANVLDRSLASRWSCNGVGCWIKLDLGASHSVSGVAVAWYWGSARTSDYVIATSLDDSSYTNRTSGTSSGTTVQPELYSFAAVNARYVRITVNGNSWDNWASISEAVPYGGDASSYDGRTLASWKVSFDQAYAVDWPSFTSRAAGGSGNDMYYMDNAFLAAVAAYQAWGDTRYITDALSLAETWISKAANHGDGYLGWTATNSSFAFGLYGESVLSDINSWRAVGRLLRVIRSTPALYSAYSSRYQAVLDFAETNIFQKWWSRGQNTYIYGFSTSNTKANWGFLAYDLDVLSGYGDTDVAWRSNYATAWQTLAASVRGWIYTIDAGPPEQKGIYASGTTSLDTPHANQALGFVAEVYECSQLGIGPAYFTSAEVAGIIATLRLRTWNGSQWTMCLNGLSTGCVSISSQNQRGIEDEIARMARFDLANFQPVIEAFAYSGTNWENSTYYANAASNLTWVGESTGGGGSSTIVRDGTPTVLALTTTSQAVTPAGTNRKCVVGVGAVSSSADPTISVTEGSSTWTAGTAVTQLYTVGAFHVRSYLRTFWAGADTTQRTLSLSVTNAPYGRWFIDCSAGAVQADGATGSSTIASSNTPYGDLTATATGSYVYSVFAGSGNCDYLSAQSGTSLVSTSADWRNQGILFARGTDPTASASSQRLGFNLATSCNDGAAVSMLELK